MDLKLLQKDLRKKTHLRTESVVCRTPTFLPGSGHKAFKMDIQLTVEAMPGHCFKESHLF